MSEYKIQFDFTTWHRGSRFVGRSGEIVVTSKDEVTDADKLDDELINACAQAIHSVKPSYKIFLLTIKNIIPIDKKETANAK